MYNSSFIEFSYLSDVNHFVTILQFLFLCLVKDMSTTVQMVDTFSGMCTVLRFLQTQCIYVSKAKMDLILNLSHSLFTLKGEGTRWAPCQFSAPLMQY